MKIISMFLPVARNLSWCDTQVCEGSQPETKAIPIDTPPLGTFADSSPLGFRETRRYAGYHGSWI
jgi:hypothetical protein